MHLVRIQHAFLKKQLIAIGAWLLFSSSAPGQFLYYISDSRDGQKYSAVHIDDLWWMAENLNIGKRINYHFLQEDNGIIEKYCLYDYDEYCDIFGGLYQWDELMQYVNTDGNQGICPSGWHISTEDEWEHLERYLGMNQSSIDSFGLRGYNEGGMLKYPGTDYWRFPNAMATDSVGFGALPGGYRDTSGYTYGYREYALFSVAATSEGKAVYRDLWNDRGKIGKKAGEKGLGGSVRCIKDTPFMFVRDSLTDFRDGRKYAIILIENHWWMAQNLNIGERINTNTQPSDDGVIQKYCYNDDMQYCDAYGGFYYWNEAMNYNKAGLQGICPDGWHIPTDENWMELEWAVGFSESDLDKEDWRGTGGVFLQKEGGSGFNALRSGKIYWTSTSEDLDQYDYFWSSREEGSEDAWIRTLYKDSLKIERLNVYKTHGFSVRCVCDKNEKISLSVDMESNNGCPGQEIALTASTSGGSHTKSYRWWSVPEGFSSEDSVTVVAPEVTTTYYARIIDGNIYIRDAVTVNVLPAPEFSISGNTSVCSSDGQWEYIATGKSSYTFSWGGTDGTLISTSGNKAVINWGSTPGTKYIDVTATDNETGCQATKRLWVNVLPSPKPGIILKGTSLLICKDSGQVYQWYHNDAAIKDAEKQFYYAKGQETGVYKVEITWENQCRNYSEPIHFIKKSTGNGALQTVFISPNPVARNILLEMINEYTGPVEISIINISGRLVKQFHGYKSAVLFTASLDTDGLDEGSYLVAAGYGSEREICRIVLTKQGR